MKRISVILGALLVVLAAAGTGFAAEKKVPCTTIQQALAGGKSEAAVAKEMKIPVARVNHCAHAGKQPKQ
jgi:hypothetical protein